MEWSVCAAWGHRRRFPCPVSGKGADDERIRWGGWKYPECRLAGGALNHADLAAVVERVRSLNWAYPTNVQLLLKDQEETYFRLWMFRDGVFGQFAPPPEVGNEESAHG